MAKNGGKRPGAGRPVGAKGKVGQDIREMAREYAPGAMAEIYRLSCESESEQVRLKACEIVVDRAWGRPTQQVEGSIDLGITIQIVRYSDASLSNKMLVDQRDESNKIADHSSA